MNDNIIVTNIYQIIYVGAQEYPEKRTSFGTIVPCQELIYNISTDNIIFFGENTLQEKPGSVRYLPEGSVSRYVVERNHYGDCIDIFFSANQNLADSAFVQNAPNNKRMEELFKLAFATWVRKDSRSRFEAMSILYKILSELQKDSSVHDSKFRILKPAVAYINENFIKKTISYEDMALACGISTSYLKKLFTECYKIPPRQYVIKMKINFACDLLIDHHYSVSEIAEMAGFGDVYYFSRIFKKETGLSPTEYQHKYRSSK